MGGSNLKRWTVLSGVLGVGLFVGLVIAGSWSITPAGVASEAGRLLGSAVEAVSGVAMRQSPAAVPEELSAVPPQAPDPALASLPSTRTAAARVRPAVVSVEIKRWQEGRDMSFHFDLPNMPEQFRRMLPDQQGDDLPNERVNGFGSGFLFTEDGYIITNNHVVVGAEEIEVVLPDKRRFKASLVGTDELTDVAVIKIDTRESLPTVQLGDSESLEIGDWVLAVGNPLQFNYTVTIGIVSAKGRSLPGIDPQKRMIQNFIQTDAVINRGNSGGPLVDLNGNVVGINSAIASSSGVSEGYGFAIPINLARAVATDMIKYGEVRRGYMGIYFNEMTARHARAVSLPDDLPTGALVQSILHGGAADEAGVQDQDIILEINGTRIDNSGQLQAMVSTLKPGTTIDVLLYRGGTSTKVGERKRVKINLKERPTETVTTAARPETPRLDALGLDVEALSRSDARRLGFDGQGVVISDLERYGPAFDASLNGNWVIVSVDGQVTPDVESYRRAVDELKSGSYVLVRVFIPGSPTGQEYTSIPVEVR